MDRITELFHRYRDDVYRLAVSYTRSPQEAEDVSHSVFMKLLEADVAPGKEKAWLMQVTANQCRSLLRSHWWKRTAPLEEGLAAEAPQTGEVLRAVMTLSPKYRVVIYLHYYEGCSTGEIAKMLHISQSAVTTRLSRGRALLKDQIGED